MPNNESEICIAGVVSPLHGAEIIEDIASTVISSARRYPHRFLGVYKESESLRKALIGCNVVILIVGSGGSERIIYDAFANYGGGLLMVSYNGNNSLAAAIEVLPALRDLGVKVSLYHHRLGHDRKGLDDYVRVGHAISKFRSSRLGVLGSTAPWLVYTGITSGEAMSYGPEVVEIGLDRLYSYYMYASDKEAAELARMYRGRSSNRISDGDLVNVMKLHLAIKRIIEEEKLDAYTIDEYEVGRVLRVVPCFTIGYHNSSGIVAGSEGDLQSLLSMMIAHYVSGSPVFQGDLGDVEQDTIVLSHCTAPLNMGSYLLTTHYGTGYPASVSVTPPQGRAVTLMKLDHRIKKFIVSRGTIVASTPRTNLCRTQLVIRVPFNPETLLQDPRGNHYVVVLGDHAWKAMVAGGLLGLEVVDLTG